MKYFSFGKNWKNYVRHVLGEREIKEAKKSLLRYLAGDEYKEKIFIDIGCGSGLFSLAALKLGCRKVISFDVDKHSVEAAQSIKERFIAGDQSDWEIFEGSILDDNLVGGLEKRGDVVYSWGVLHHTGNMYRAIANAGRLVKNDGYFILAIYNHAPSSAFWLKIKKIYNHSPFVVQKIIIYFFYFYSLLLIFLASIKNLLIGRPLTLKNPRRGMNFFYNVVDWIGGYPYEYASFDEIKNYVEKLGFRLLKSPTRLPVESKNFFDRFTFRNTANNEFVFFYERQTN